MIENHRSGNRKRGFGDDFHRIRPDWHEQHTKKCEAQPKNEDVIHSEMCPKPSLRSDCVVVETVVEIEVAYYSLCNIPITAEPLVSKAR